MNKTFVKWMRINAREKMSGIEGVGVVIGVDRLRKVIEQIEANLWKIQKIFTEENPWI